MHYGLGYAPHSLSPAGQTPGLVNGLCPDGAPPSADVGCGIDTRTAEERASQDATTRRNQDFTIAGQLVTALVTATANIVNTVETADTARTRARLEAETAQAIHNLSTSAPNDPNAQALISDLQRQLGALQGRGEGSSSSSSKTMLVVGAVALVGVVGIGAYVLTRRGPARPNPVVGHGRDRHFVKASKLKHRG